MSPEPRRRTIGVVRAELRSLDNVEAPEGLHSYRPHDPENFAIVIAAVVGEPDTSGGDLFYFTGCSARWLAENPPEKGLRGLRQCFLMQP